MPARNPAERRLYSLKGHAARYHPGTDTTELDREIKAVRAAYYIAELVDSAPPLSAETRSRLAVLLLTPSGGDAG